MLKHCSGCDRWLEASAEFFHRNSNGGCSLGLVSKCKECKRKYREDNANKFSEKAKLRREKITETQREKERLRSAKYRANRSEEQRLAEKLRKKEYRINNKDKIKSYDKSYHQRPEVKKRLSKYYQDNKEARRLMYKKWLSENPGKRAEYSARSYGKRKLRSPDWRDNEEILHVYRMCEYLNNMGANFQVDHIVPLVSEKVSGLHVRDNLRLIPARENLSKSNKFEPSDDCEIPYQSDECILEIADGLMQRYVS